MQLVEALRYKSESHGFDTPSVIEIFHLHNSSDRSMTLGLTQPLTEMGTRNISWAVKAAGAYGWQPYHLLMPIVSKSGSLSLLEPSGPLRSCNGIALPLPFFFILLLYSCVHSFSPTLCVSSFTSFHPHILAKSSHAKSREWHKIIRLFQTTGLTTYPCMALFLTLL